MQKEIEQIFSDLSALTMVFLRTKDVGATVVHMPFQTPDNLFNIDLRLENRGMIFFLLSIVRLRPLEPITPSPP